MSEQPLQLPCLIFKTGNQMEDHLADDMRYGDLTESQLKQQFGLNNVSNFVDPYTLKRKKLETRSESVNYLFSNEESLSVEECSQALFNEMLSLSNSLVSPFSFYSGLIREMINHMHYKNGGPYCNALLNQALKEQIKGDTDKENSSLLVIKDTIEKNIDWDKKILLNKFLPESNKAIYDTRLPKFNRYSDTFNGLGITVHDIHAIHITLKSLRIEGNRYYATIHYKAQDHFGIDKTDIMHWRFHNFVFFRIWFILQRYDRFSYKPFMTNMEATIEISGGGGE